jgi:uncharacterized protein YfcZ (UPF0381/DUF406 family)
MTKQIKNKKELNAHIKTLCGISQAVSDEFHEIARTNQKLRVDRWKQAGGCQKCRGRRQYVVWDTLDSMSGCYAEFETCSECTVDSRLVGVAPDCAGKYDRVGGTTAQVEAAIKQWETEGERQRQDESALASATAWKEIENLRFAFEQHHSTDNNKEMVVTRKWKHIHKGMRGIVFWKRGNRVGLRLDDERCEKGFYKNTLWCNESQLGNPVPFTV